LLPAPPDEPMTTFVVLVSLAVAPFSTSSAAYGKAVDGDDTVLPYSVAFSVALPELF
jgi:hypothetical protein